MPSYLLTLCHADGRTGSAQRGRWWADDASAIDQAYRWLRLARHVAGPLGPAFDRWTVARYDRRGFPIIIAYGGIDDVPATLVPGSGAEVDVTPPPGRPGARASGPHG